MRFSSLVSSLLFVFSTLALAQSQPENAEPIQPEAAEEDEAAKQANEEMIVLSRTIVAKKRAALEKKLKRLGYDKFIRKDGRTIVRHALSYRPTVVLDDDGWIDVKRSPIRFEPPGKFADSPSKLRYLWCLPPFTPFCVKVGGQTVSRRRLMTYKRRVAERSRGYTKDWQEAVIAHAMEGRLNKDIPEMLDSIWANGLTGAQDSSLLETPKARRQAILKFWASRACVKEGAQARQLAWDFIVYEVQVSSHPADAEEIEAANAAQACPEATPMPMSDDR